MLDKRWQLTCRIRHFGGVGRYGFNGKERDKDMNSLTAYDYGFRIYNPAIGKFLSVDPLMKSYPWYTPYQFAGNKVINSIDLDGLEEASAIGGPGKRVAKLGNKNAESVTIDQVYNSALLTLSSYELLTHSNTSYYSYGERSKEHQSLLDINIAVVNTGVLSPNIQKANRENVEYWDHEMGFLGSWFNGKEHLKVAREILTLDGATREDQIRALQGYVGMVRTEWAGISEAGVEFGNILLSYGVGSTPSAKSMRVSRVSTNSTINIQTQIAAKASTKLLGAAPANLTQKRLDHIIARHWFTSGAKGAGKFAQGTTRASLKEMIQTATTQGIFRPNTMGRAGTIAEFNFGRVIGTTSGGAPASRLRVVIGTNGNVITAFPF